MATWRDRLIAVLDTETTGLDPAVDSIVEIGVALARIEERGATVVQSRSWLVRPRRPIPAEATAVHGITNDEVATAATFASVLPAVVEMVGPDAVLAGYNARFDRAMVLACCLAEGCAVPSWLTGAERGGWIDVLTWARAFEPWLRGAGHFKLGTVAERRGVEVDTAHRAAGDAATAARVLGVLASMQTELGDRMPDDIEALRLWQRILTAEREADFLRWLAKKPPRPETTKETAAS